MSTWLIIFFVFLSLFAGFFLGSWSRQSEIELLRTVAASLLDIMLDEKDKK